MYNINNQAYIHENRSENLVQLAIHKNFHA